MDERPVIVSFYVLLSSSDHRSTKIGKPPLFLHEVIIFVNVPPEVPAILQLDGGTGAPEIFSPHSALHFSTSFRRVNNRYLLKTILLARHNGRK